MFAKLNDGSSGPALTVLSAVLAALSICFSSGGKAQAFPASFAVEETSLGTTLLHMAQSSEDACPSGQIMIGGKCRTLGKKPAAQPEETSDTNSDEAGDACAAGQVMIGGKCRTLGKKPEAQPEETSDADSDEAGDACAAGQVMIGGKCRTLGKKPEAQPEETSDTNNDEAGDACVAGQVMIGGKCRTLGKKPEAQPEETSDTNDDEAGDACAAGQVMIGGKCRTLGKKPEAQPEETSDTNDDQAGDACAAGRVMIGGKCRKLGDGSATSPGGNGDESEDGEAPGDAGTQNAEGSFLAGSWGGIVRAGPGRNFPKVASLREGARVTVIKQASDLEDGYPWYEIEFGNSQTGFQWGGIMCSLDAPRNGLFQTCEAGQSNGDANIRAPGSSQDVNGENVNFVRHAAGHFASTGDGSWVEYDATGNPSFRFTETGRDERSVYLRDTSRNVDLQLDLHQKRIFYSDPNTSRAPLYDISDVSAASDPQDQPAGGAGDGLVWQSKWFNDADSGALTSQLIFGIPETDAVKLFGNCGGRSKDELSLVIWSDVAARKNGSRVKVQFSSDRIEKTYRGTVQRSASGEDLQGYRISMKADDPLWAAMSAGRSISYGESGREEIVLPLAGSRAAITNFLSGCRLIDQSQGD